MATKRRKKSANTYVDKGAEYTAMDKRAIDALYGLEPVIEIDIEDSDADPTPFVTIRCPYCDESFDTRLDLSAGSFVHIEDCQVCCQPIEVAVDVNASGSVRSVEARRMG